MIPEQEEFKKIIDESILESDSSGIASTLMCAGCMFTDGIHILAGLQRKKECYTITGIGGCGEQLESIEQTAIRETIEELLNVTDVNINLINSIISTIIPKKKFMSEINDYCTLVYDFDQLSQILKMAHGYYLNHELNSNIYSTFPLNLVDLIFNRQKSDNVEIDVLCLLPVTENISIHQYFVHDLNKVLAMLK